MNYEGKDLRQYIRYLRQREEELAAGWVQLVPPLAIETEGVNSVVSENNFLPEK